MLSMTGSFAFEHVMDVYTLNFLHDDKTSFIYSIMDYFLALFPVFTLTSSYIIVAITLSNNVRVLIKMIQSATRKSRSVEFLRYLKPFFLEPQNPRKVSSSCPIRTKLTPSHFVRPPRLKNNTRFFPSLLNMAFRSLLSSCPL